MESETGIGFRVNGRFYPMRETGIKLGEPKGIRQLTGMSIEEYGLALIDIAQRDGADGADAEEVERKLEQVFPAMVYLAMRSVDRRVTADMVEQLDFENVEFITQAVPATHDEENEPVPPAQAAETPPSQASLQISAPPLRP